jgi:hypothetical protein
VGIFCEGIVDSAVGRLVWRLCVVLLVGAFIGSGLGAEVERVGPISFAFCTPGNSYELAIIRKSNGIHVVFPGADVEACKYPRPRPTALPLLSARTCVSFAPRARRAMKIPYANCDFADIRRDGYFYVDKTPFIPHIENFDGKHQIFLAREGLASPP